MIRQEVKKGIMCGSHTADLYGVLQSSVPSQCSKLTVHSAGRTFFGYVRPMCARFFT